MGFKEGLYVDRIFQLFDEDGDSAVTFVEFICGLSILSTKGSLEEKMQFSFQIYDFDGDGKISRAELQHMLNASLVESDLKLTEPQIELLLDETFQQVNLKGDGFIDYQEYQTFVKENPRIMEVMTIDVKKKVERLKARQEAAEAAEAAGGEGKD